MLLLDCEAFGSTACDVAKLAVIQYNKDHSPHTRMELRDREGSCNYTAPRVNWKISDFDVIRRLGAGSCSTVAQCVHKETGCEYAIKIIDKSVLKRNNLMDCIVRERSILDKLQYDGVARLKFTFQDPCHLYLGLECCPQGDLADQILEERSLNDENRVVYIAEVVLILEYLRSQGIVHRDVKPENLVLTEDGHLKLVDFGCAKDLRNPVKKSPKQRRVSFVGTADYIAPEVLFNTEINYSTDLWGLGCLAYQIFTGKPPFKGGSEYLTYENISNCEFSYPEGFPSVAKDLVDSLLRVEPITRLGADSMDDLKGHEFFRGINWDTLRTDKMPGFVPRSPTSLDDELDWDLKSLAEALPVQYQYVVNVHAES